MSFHSAAGPNHHVFLGMDGTQVPSELEICFVFKSFNFMKKEVTSSATMQN